MQATAERAPARVWRRHVHPSTLGGVMTGRRTAVPTRLLSRRGRTRRRARERVTRAAESVARTAPVAQNTLRDRPALVSSLAVASTFLLIGVIGAVIGAARRRRQEETDGTR